MGGGGGGSSIIRMMTGAGPFPEERKWRLTPPHPPLLPPPILDPEFPVFPTTASVCIIVPMACAVLNECLMNEFFHSFIQSVSNCLFRACPEGKLSFPNLFLWKLEISSHPPQGHMHKHMHTHTPTTTNFHSNSQGPCMCSSLIHI